VDTIRKIIVMEISCTLGVIQNREFNISYGHPTVSRTCAKQIWRDVEKSKIGEYPPTAPALPTTAVTQSVHLATALLNTTQQNKCLQNTFDSLYANVTALL